MTITFSEGGDHLRSSPSLMLRRNVGFALAGFVRMAVAAHRRARTRRILNGLDDNALKDIGLQRGQIDGVECDARYTHYI